MARGKKTDIETKAKIATLRITKGMLGSDIAQELWVNERTVQRVINNEVSEVVGNSTIIQSIISDATEASRIMGEITLNLARDLRHKQKEKLEYSSDEVKTLNTTVDSAFKRSQLIQDKPTENFSVSNATKQKNLLAMKERLSQPSDETT